uniref:Putative secreted peptide n=1 Tax=Anopheles braziliensis TaxID=58242 RepID=A0A2M3ZXJ2_9DIPT
MLSSRRFTFRTSSCLLAVHASVSMNGSKSFGSVRREAVALAKYSVPTVPAIGLAGDIGVVQRDRASGW